MRVRRGIRYVFVAILCSLCAAPAAGAAKRRTVKGELRGMLDAGTLAPADYQADRAIYADARAQAKMLSGTRRLELAAERAGGLAWEYLFPFDGQRPPWASSLAQGTGLQAMARVATRVGRQADVMPILHRGLGIFQTSPPEGVMIPDGAGAHYLQ